MKKTLILIFLLLLTGCKAKYDLKLNFDGTIAESGTIYINSNLLGKNGYPAETDEFLKQVASEYGFSNYRSKRSFNDSNYFGYHFSHKYSNINYYLSQSPAIKNLFGRLSVEEKEHYVIFKTSGGNKISTYHDLKKDTPTVVENISISITLPYKVVKHNATRVDNSTNTYTWIFNGTSNGDIDLEYRDNEIYTIDILNLFKFISWYIYAIVLLVIVGLIVYFNARNQSKFRNRI